MRVIEAKGIRKKIGDQVLLNGVSFSVEAGECLGIFGPKQSGKTTLLKCIYGASDFEAGEVFVKGLNIKNSALEIKAQMGIVPFGQTLESEISLIDNLSIYAGYQGLRGEVKKNRIDQLIREIEIEPFVDFLPPSLKFDVYQRASLARSMVHNPSILILDEISRDVSAKEKKWIWNYLNQLKKNGISIIVTTSSVEEVENYCNKVVLLDRGNVISYGNPDVLMKDHIGTQVIEFKVQRQELQYYLTRLKGGGFLAQSSDEVIQVYLFKQEDAVAALSLVQGKTVTIREPRLTDLYFKLGNIDLKENI